MNTTATTARQAAEAAYTADPNPANLKALQAAGKAEMDEVLGRFDARQTAEEAAPQAAPAAPAPRKALHTTTAVAPLVYRTGRSRRHAAQMHEMQVRMDARPAITVTPEMDAAYRQYISDGIGDTDGYYAPINRDSFFRLYYAS